VVITVGYRDGRRGVVELVEDASVYGGTLRTKQVARPFVADMSRAYADLLARVAAFFQGGDAPVSPEETLEIMAMLDAAERSSVSGREEALYGVDAPGVGGPGGGR
jgi:predicted dehydrogenase